MAPLIPSNKVCGSCTACCKLVGVTELEKPAGTACRYAVGGKGCSIYTMRPNSCRSFYCVWLQTANMPDELRPDRSHAVIAYMGGEDKTFHVWVDKGHRKAWKREPLFSLFKKMTEQGYRIIITLNGEDHRSKIVFERHGSIAGFRKAKFTAPDSKGDQFEVKLP